MKPLMLVLCLLLVQPCYAVWGGAVKEGYVSYEAHHKSDYEGGNIWDSEQSTGAYLEYQKDCHLFRLDASYVYTGNELDGTINKPYELTHLNQTLVTLNYGQEHRGFYWLLGGGVSFNNVNIGQYDAYPFSYSIDHSPVVRGVIGYRHNITKNLYTFIEADYNLTKADVYVDNEKQFTSNLSRHGVWVGLGYKF